MPASTKGEFWEVLIKCVLLDSVPQTTVLLLEVTEMSRRYNQARPNE